MVIEPKMKISQLLIDLPYELYMKLKYKSYEDGFSMRRAVQLLIEYYVNERIEIKD